MNNQLLEKLIKYSSETCPPLNLDNPLLDINVSQALSNSFVKILEDSRENSNVNSNLRQSVLENIRRLCTTEPENHVRVTEDYAELISELYQNKFKDSFSVDKMLDEFLLKKSIEGNINSRFEYSMSPESIQALINLNDSGNLDVLSKEIIHWNAKNEKYKTILKNLWDHNLLNLNKEGIDSLSIKMKPEIEKTVLEQSLKGLENRDMDLDEIFSENSFDNIIKTSAKSPICFQICISTLNCLLIGCIFDDQILSIIQRFIIEVKKFFSYISTLYPIHLSSAVVLMDIDFTGMPEDIKGKYIHHAITYIQNVHKESKNDLIMLLSHYPQWFDIYFQKINERSVDKGN